MVFHHGLGRSPGDVLFISNVLASSGMVVAATDAAKHGARSWCVKNMDTGVSTGCATGATCDTTVFAQQQGDPTSGKPGLCTGNALELLPIGCNPAVTPGCWDGTGGNARTSGSFLISANLFRSRDTVRQDILDQSMLVRVLTTARGQAALATAAASSAPSATPAAAQTARPDFLSPGDPAALAAARAAGVHGVGQAAHDEGHARQAGAEGLLRLPRRRRQ